MPDDLNPDPDETFVAGRAQPPESFASGRYTVLRILGEGGQKVVYLVHDDVLDRDCALSMIRSATVRIRRSRALEARSAGDGAARCPPNVVTVYDFGDEDGTPYLVCEYVPGGDLRRELATAAGAVDWSARSRIASDIAAGADGRARRGVIHRDVKPANVWLGDDGSAKLGDFGLAFSLDRSRMTMPGIVVGTAAYMAPEQARGDEVGERTDLYALGVAAVRDGLRTSAVRGLRPHGGCRAAHARGARRPVVAPVGHSAAARSAHHRIAREVSERASSQRVSGARPTPADRTATARVTGVASSLAATHAAPGRTAPRWTVAARTIVQSAPPKRRRPRVVRPASSR